jgi:NAD(P)-dependent dehydrogenase (short-subunit alcohol dehydrogenase family)
MPNRLEGKTAIVTGAGTSGPGWGNGKAAAVLFAREGARVCCIDVDAAAGAATAALIRDEGGQAISVACDVAKSTDVAAAVALCRTSFGAIDILHNNVGILAHGGPVELAEEDWDRVLRVNLKSMYLTAKHVLPVFLEQFAATGKGGAIVNIASIAGIRYLGIPYIAYSTAKGAVVPFTQSLAVQYAAKGIRANCILPGLMNTPMIVEPLRAAYGGDVAHMIAARDAQCPSGKMGDAWDVAYAALFLASDEAKYVTGVHHAQGVLISDANKRR